ncbi:MAG: Eco57I restriction-modification methylase domain-containing protein [Promethearchaeota archaeon]
MVIKNNSSNAKEPIGQYFTPSYIAEFMVKNIFNFIKYSEKNSKNFMVLEPSVGEGIFLKYLLKYSFSNITAYELDYNLKHQLVKFYPNVNLRFENFLGSDPNEKFDIIIGNPPYLGQNYNAAIFQEYVNKFPLCAKYFVGNMDLFYFFIHMAIEKLKPGGILTFITTNYWITKSNKTGIKYLKPHLLENCFLLQYIDLSHVNIFKGAKGQRNCIFVIKKKKVQEKILNVDQHIEIIQFYNENLSYKRKYTSALTNNDLKKDESWNLIYPKEVQIYVDKIEKFCKIKEKISYLQDYFIIRNGLILIKDSIFILNEGENLLVNNNDFFICIDGEFIKINDAEKNRLKKIYKSKSIKNYGYNNENKIGYLIYFNKNEFKSKDCQKRNKLLQMKYPNLSRYIEQFKVPLIDILINAKENPEDIYYPRRGSFIQQGNRGKRNNLVDLEPLYDYSEKIFFKYISNENVFGYSEGSFYATSDTYFLWPKKTNSRIDNLFILSYLNSRLVYFLFKAKNLSIKRSKSKLEQGLPIPNLRNFETKEKKPTFELVKILTQVLIKNFENNYLNDVIISLEKQFNSEYLSSFNNINFRKNLINAIRNHDKKYIEKTLDRLIFKLFDLDQNIINNLLSAYYNS